MKKIVFGISLLMFNFIHSQELSLKFDHYAILVDNLEISAKFYQDVLLLPEIDDKTELAHIRWFSLGNSELHVIEDKVNKITHHQGVHFALAVNNLDEFRKHLEKQKISYINWFGKPNTTNTRPDGIRQIYIRDPDGYWIEINGK